MSAHRPPTTWVGRHQPTPVCEWQGAYGRVSGVPRCALVAEASVSCCDIWQCLPRRPSMGSSEAICSKWPSHCP